MLILPALAALALAGAPPAAEAKACDHDHAKDKSAAHAEAGPDCGHAAGDGKAACDHAECARKAAPAGEAKGGKLLRGEKLKGAPKVTLAKLLASPSDHVGKQVSVEGPIRKACTNKGCWMELAAAQKGPGVRVKFKDYAFFVPLDSAGKYAKVEGEVKVAQLSEASVKHYESEGATVPRDAKGQATEVQLVASGVELSDTPKK